jgi:hypothetical protein
VDYEEADKWMQARLDKWNGEVEAQDALDSLAASEITNLAYEARDLREVAEAMVDLADELWQLEHDHAAGMTDVAARAVRMAADRIGAING